MRRRLGFPLGFPACFSPYFFLCGALGALQLWGCGPQVFSLYAQSPESCAPEYRFTAVLSGNVLAITLAKDNPGDIPDEIPAVLTYKQQAEGQSFELTPDPTGAGDILDAPPPLLAKVVGTRACLAPFEAADSTGDACLQSWLQTERCFDLEKE